MDVCSRATVDDFFCKKFFGPKQLDNVVDDLGSATRDPEGAHLNACAIGERI